MTEFQIRMDTADWLHTVVTVVSQPHLDIHHVSPWVIAGANLGCHGNISHLPVLAMKLLLLACYLQFLEVP